MEKNKMTPKPQAKPISGSPWTGLYLGLSPLPVTVNTRIDIFLVGDPYKTFICHCYWEGGTTQLVPIQDTYIDAFFSSVQKTWVAKKTCVDD